jgi:hypothetical protein
LFNTFHLKSFFLFQFLHQNNKTNNTNNNKRGKKETGNFLQIRMRSRVHKFVLLEKEIQRHKEKERERVRVTVENSFSMFFRNRLVPNLVQYFGIM